jgi:hypothetical protein
MSQILTVTLQILAIILGSGALSAFLTHFLTTGVAEKHFRREKLEQLYLAGRKYCETSLDSADSVFPPDRGVIVRVVVFPATASNVSI